MSISVSNEECRELLDFFDQTTFGSPYDGVHLVAERHGISTTTACAVERVLRRARTELNTVDQAKQSKGD